MQTPNNQQTFSFDRTGATTGDDTERAKLYIKDNFGKPGIALANNVDVVKPPRPLDSDYGPALKKLTYPDDIAAHKRELSEIDAHNNRLWEWLHTSCDADFREEVK